MENHKTLRIRWIVRKNIEVLENEASILLVLAETTRRPKAGKQAATGAPPAPPWPHKACAPGHIDNNTICNADVRPEPFASQQPAHIINYRLNLLDFFPAAVFRVGSDFGLTWSTSFAEGSNMSVLIASWSSLGLNEFAAFITLQCCIRMFYDWFVVIRIEFDH